MSQLEKKIIAVLMMAVLAFSFYFLFSSWRNSVKSPIFEDYIFSKPEFISKSEHDDGQYSVRFYTEGTTSLIVRKYLSLLARDRWNIIEIKTVGAYNTILSKKSNSTDSDISDYLIIQIDGTNATDIRRGVTLTYWSK